MSVVPGVAHVVLLAVAFANSCYLYFHFHLGFFDTALQQFLECLDVTSISINNVTVISKLATSNKRNKIIVLQNREMGFKP